jgi:hypothetical protein
VKRDLTTAVACSLETGDLVKVRERWDALALRAIVGVERTTHGLRLLFAARPGVEEELDELAELERRCCAFADWSVSGEGEHVALAVSAQSPEGVAAVQAMFAAHRG